MNSSIVAVMSSEGKWIAPAASAPQPQQPQPQQLIESNVIEFARSDFDRAVDYCGAIVRLAQGFSRDDQYRIRNLVHATLSALKKCSTSLPVADQRLFEASVRKGK